MPTYSPRISSHTIRPFASLLASEAVSSRPAFTDFVRRSSQILENVAAAAASAALSESLFKLQGREGGAAAVREGGRDFAERKAGRPYAVSEGRVRRSDGKSRSEGRPTRELNLRCFFKAGTLYDYSKSWL